MDIKRFEFVSNGNEQGQLVALESNKNVPFEIKRVYYIVKTVDDVVRGKHAHRNLQQILICVNGSFKLKLDDGDESVVIEMNKHNEGIYVSNGMWREMYDFAPGTVLLVLASEYYDTNDYIRDYDEFLEYAHSLKEKAD